MYDLNVVLDKNGSRCQLVRSCVCKAARLKLKFGSPANDLHISQPTGIPGARRPQNLLTEVSLRFLQSQTRKKEMEGKHRRSPR